MTTRSGTETRQRTRQVGVRLTPAEYATLTAHATREGVSPGELLRRAYLDAGLWTPNPERSDP